VLFAQQGSDTPIRIATALRGQPLVLTGEGDDVFVALARQAVDAAAPPVRLVADLLAAPGLVPESAPLVASVGSPKLLVEVADSAVLQGLRPDLARIVDWGKANGVNGLYVYCRLGEGVYEGRNFNHLDPAHEDRATGVAAGALTALLGCAISLYQADKRCLIRTRIDGDAILVGGRA
jgi:predicted PhzF superfamily epimerase YddE/YHI9